MYMLRISENFDLNKVCMTDQSLGIRNSTEPPLNLEAYI